MLRNPSPKTTSPGSCSFCFHPVCIGSTSASPPYQTLHSSCQRAGGTECADEHFTIPAFCAAQSSFGTTTQAAMNTHQSRHRRGTTHVATGCKHTAAGSELTADGMGKKTFELRKHVTFPGRTIKFASSKPHVRLRVYVRTLTTLLGIPIPNSNFCRDMSNESRPFQPLPRMVCLVLCSFMFSSRSSPRWGPTRSVTHVSDGCLK